MMAPNTPSAPAQFVPGETAVSQDRFGSMLGGAALALVAASVLLSGQSRAGRTLDIYVIDAEGGNATLFVSPAGQSLLVDTSAGN